MLVDREEGKNALKGPFLEGESVYETITKVHNISHLHYYNTCSVIFRFKQQVEDDAETEELQTIIRNNRIPSVVLNCAGNIVKLIQGSKPAEWVCYTESIVIGIFTPIYVAYILTQLVRSNREQF